MAPMSIVLQFAPSREAQHKTKRKLRQHIKDAKEGRNTAPIARLQHDDMIDLTGGE